MVDRIYTEFRYSGSSLEPVRTLAHSRCGFQTVILDKLSFAKSARWDSMHRSACLEGTRVEAVESGFIMEPSILCIF
jgi:hypothetical protein